jgi:hypothetical protein
LPSIALQPYPKSITWKIPKENTLLDYVKLSNLHQERYDYTIPESEQVKEGDRLAGARGEITLTQKAQEDAPPIPLSITCELKEGYNSSYASESYNKITCIIDGVYEANYYISFGKGETDGTIFVSADDTTNVVAYGADGKLLQKYKDNNGITITIKPSARALSTGLWAKDQKIIITYNTNNSLFKRTGSSYLVTVTKTISSDDTLSIQYTIPLKDLFSEGLPTEDKN